jgi:hypothetical protein
MAIWTSQTIGTNLSQIVEADDAQDSAIRSFERGSTEPGTKLAGQFWACQNSSTLSTLTASQVGGPWDEAIVRWSGSAWTLLADPDHPCLNAGGTVKMTASLDANNNKIINMAAGSADGDSARTAEVLYRNGSFDFRDQFTMQTAADVSGTYQIIEAGTGKAFTPRRLDILLFGAVTLQVGGTSVGTLGETFITTRRSEGNVGGSYAGRSGRHAVWTGTIGSTACTLYVDGRYTAGTNGVYVSLERDSDSERMNVAVRQLWADGSPND